MNIKHIQILSDAENDLYAGRDFYAQQGEKLGNYFWDSLLSDIESLVIFAGIHPKLWVLSNAFEAFSLRNLL